MEKGCLNHKGLSLIELIIVIAIMAILSAAITPAVIRFIDKARKARDVEVAQTIYDAAELAMTTSEDEAYLGWSVCVDSYGTEYPARIKANDAGYPVTMGSDNKGCRDKKCNDDEYFIRPVAWCRGVKDNISYGALKSYENQLFKSTLDDSAPGKAQREYTDEFLWCLSQEVAQGGHENKNKLYHGENIENVSIKYIKAIDCKAGPYKGTKVSPELWIVYRRDDTGACEVWTGYKKSGCYVAPLYRVYPDPAKEYK